MKTKKLVVSAALTMALLGGSSGVFASDDSMGKNDLSASHSLSTQVAKLTIASESSDSHFSAFDGVATEPVSQAELNAVSGKGVIWRNNPYSRAITQLYDIGQAIGFAASCVTAPQVCTPNNLPVWMNNVNGIIGSGITRYYR